MKPVLVLSIRVDQQAQLTGRSAAGKSLAPRPGGVSRRIAHRLVADVTCCRTRLGVTAGESSGGTRSVPPTASPHLCCFAVRIFRNRFYARVAGETRARSVYIKPSRSRYDQTRL